MQGKPGRYDAQRSGDEERRKIRLQHGARDAGAESGACRAQLMAGEYPPEHQIGLVAAEGFYREVHRRRHGGDPIQSIEQSEYRKPRVTEGGEWQVDEREATQT